MASQQQSSSTLPPWKWVPGYEGYYYATRTGRLFTMYSRGRNKSEIAAHSTELMGGLDKDGYRKAILVLAGKRAYVRVHAVVALAFNGPMPEGTVCAHLNGDKLDNRPSNLVYVSQATNIAHKEAHGTKLFGERSPSAKLTEIQARSIKSDSDRWASIAAKYGVSKSTVMGIKTGRTWKHIG